MFFLAISGDVGRSNERRLLLAAGVLLYGHLLFLPFAFFLLFLLFSDFRFPPSASFVDRSSIHPRNLPLSLLAVAPLLKVSGLRGDRRTQTSSLVREVRVYDETIGSCDGCLGVERRGMETRSLGVDVSWSLSWHREDASWRKVRQRIQPSFFYHTTNYVKR